MVFIDMFMALIKMKLLANDLYDHKWSRACPVLLTHLGTLNQIFRRHCSWRS